MIANRVLDAGTDLQADHPGFHDQTYRRRRQELATFAMNHKWNTEIAEIDYSENEIKCWTAVWDRMAPLWEKYACKEYLHSLDLMVKHCNYDRTNIPRQSDISNFLESTTNFKLRPVAGLLSSRDFLSGLAHRTFFCTQYIRVSQSSSFQCRSMLFSFHNCAKMQSSPNVLFCVVNASTIPNPFIPQSQTYATNFSGMLRCLRIKTFATLVKKSDWPVWERVTKTSRSWRDAIGLVSSLASAKNLIAKRVSIE